MGDSPIYQCCGWETVLSTNVKGGRGWKTAQSNNVIVQEGVRQPNLTILLWKRVGDWWERVGDSPI